MSCTYSPLFSEAIEINDNLTMMGRKELAGFLVLLKKIDGISLSHIY